ncbi:A-kinase anchor protein 4-like isoform X7 [Moschus berezovskii]|uniref:A-kinase anchor protein 4-like isoform X7 n=1 Tax=Moschus berezovskii TaxID=68408 RepID=UPI002444E73D|nr:A-kinase anchor protein 4-like isoform X7 [Moschus berezovskii]
MKQRVQLVLKHSEVFMSTVSQANRCLMVLTGLHSPRGLSKVALNSPTEQDQDCKVARGPRYSHEAGMCQSYQDCHGPEVIVNNQGSTSSFQKQLQAVLQWIAASQLNVPMLSFMGDSDGQLEKLPEFLAKAAEKGYSVGDLLQEVMKFAKERQLDEAMGNMARNQLLDWLLANL